MRNLLLLLTLIFPFLSFQGQNDSLLVVVSYKWTKTRQVMEKVHSPNPPAAAAMIPDNKNFHRNARVNDPPGTLDPNQHTVDGRSAAIEKIVQESRTPQSKSVDAFAYKLKLQNLAKQNIEFVFWEYQFIDPAAPDRVTRRQFMCATNIKQGKEKEVHAFSLSGPSDVVNVETLRKNAERPFEEKVVINRIEYADRSSWQRKDWDITEIKASYRRANATPWPDDRCRGL